MKKYEFTIIATGLDPNRDDFADRFFGAGCDDATISFQKGAIILEFDRTAKNFAHALDEAIKNVELAGATIVHIEPDHLVSLSDIAVRAGVTRAAASHYANGDRGKDFPLPVARVTTENPLWDWVEVARWLRRRGQIGLAELLRARVVRYANLEISKRRATQRVFGRDGGYRRDHRTAA